MIYNKGIAESIATTNGRYVFTTNDNQVTDELEGFEYVIRDHLGNGRVWFMDERTIQPIRLMKYGSASRERTAKADGRAMNGPIAEASAINPENRFTYNEKEFEEDWGMHNYGARFYDPAIVRFTTIDRFAEKYVDMNPYQYGANNPIKFVDINGDSLSVAFIGEHTDLAKNALYGIIENALEEQYSVSESSTGNLILSQNCGSESCEGLSEQGEAVLNELNSLFTSDEQTDIKADYANSEVHTGSHPQGIIDVADILQFNSDKSELGATQIGKIVHEFAEQREKQHSSFSTWEKNHPPAVDAENRVNNSSRKDEVGRGGKVQYFSRGNQTVRTFISTRGKYGGVSRIISVNNTKK